MDNRRLFLAALLSLGILVVWQVLFPPPEPAPVPETAAEAVGDRPSERPVPPGGGPPAAERTPAAPAVAEAGEELGAEGAEPGIPPQLVEAAEEGLEIVETPEARAAFTNRGGQLVSFELKRHENAEGGAVDLVRVRRDAPYPFGLVDPEGEPSPLNQALFAAERSRDSGRETLLFRYRGPVGAADKRYSFRPDGLFEVEVTVPGDSDWGLVLGPGIRNPTAEELENRFERRAAAYQLGEEVALVRPEKAAGVAEIPGGGLRWVGIEDTYFLTAIVPRGRLERAAIRPQLVLPAETTGPAFLDLPPREELSAEQEDLPRDLLVVLYPGDEDLEALAYFGAKDYDRLAALPYGLERTVDLGFFGFLARPLLWGLQWIHEHVIHNYGWAIILMTVLIKLLLFPLTHKSYVSMQKMQQLNPKIQAIRSKYRGKLKDKQGRPNAEAQRKMNEEVMALYKAEGVNPAGGCLPMLLQIPVLFAFYNLLSTTIELRHAPWLLWVRDLSAPDPYYVLPIVMGATQWLQQKMTPMAGDPMQRRIFLLMPIFFTVLFLGFPSGLVLYWLTNNLLTIVQQAVYNRLRQRKEGEEGAPAEAPKARPRPARRAQR